jgi:MFS family permease
MSPPSASDLAAPLVPQPIPAVEASRDPVERTMRLSVAEGGATQIFLNWTSGSVLIGYMLHFGASPFEIGLVSSVPLLAQMISPFAAWLGALAGSRKYLTAILAGVGRGLWLLAALLPQLGIPDPLKPAFLVFIVMISSTFQSAAGTLWAAWMGDVVPEDKRGRYFGTRAGIVGLIGMFANLGAGWFLDTVAVPLNFQTVLLVSVVCAAIGIYLYLLHYEPPTTISRASLMDTFRAPWRDANFRKFLLFGVYWQFTVLLAAPFVFPYFLDQLQMTFTQVSIWSVIASSCAFVTLSLWGRIADRVGNKAVLAIGTFLAGVALPSCWIMAGITGNLNFIWASAVFDAIAWGAIGPAIFNLALVSAPKANRAAFIAMYALTTGAAGFLGGLLSGPLLLVLLPFGFQVFNSTWTGYHSLFVFAGLLRAQAWFLLRPVQENNAWRTRDLLRTMRPWRLLGFPWRN